MYKQTIGAILVVNLLVGCATKQITTIRRGEPVSIVFPKSPQTDTATTSSGSDASRPISLRNITKAGPGSNAGQLGENPGLVFLN